MASYKYKVLGFSRKFKMSEVGPPPDVKEAFSKFADGGDQMSADQLRRFKVEHQCEVDCTVSDAERFIQAFLRSRPHDTTTTQQQQRHGLCLLDFFHFLFLDHLNGPIKSKVNSFSLSLFLLFFYLLFLTYTCLIHKEIEGINCFFFNYFS